MATLPSKILPTTVSGFSLDPTCEKSENLFSSKYLDTYDDSTMPSISIFSICVLILSTILGSATPSKKHTAILVCVYLPTFIISKLSLGDASLRLIKNILVFKSSIKPSLGPRSAVDTGGSATARS